MVHKYEFVSTGNGYWVQDTDGTLTEVIDQEGNIAASVASAGVGNMNQVYSNGQTITVDEGAMTFTDSSDGGLNLLELVKDGAGSGNVIDIAIDAALTGNVIDIDMNSGTGAKAIYIDNGAGARTGTDIDIKDDSSGNHTVINIASSGSGLSKGLVWTGSYNGSPGGNAIELTFDNSDNLDTGGILITRGTGVRTDNAIAIADASTGNVSVVDINISGAYTGNIIDVTTSAAATGNVFYADLDSAVAATGLHLEGSGVRTQPMVEFNTDATGSANFISSVISGAISGNVIDIAIDATVTGNVIDIDLNAGVGAKGLYIDGGGGARTADMVELKYDGSGNADAIYIVQTATGSGAVMDIDMNGTLTGEVFNVDMNNAVGAALMNIDCGGGTRTKDLFDITFDGDGNVGVMDINHSNTGSGNIFDLDVSGVHTGNAIDIVYSAAATGHALHADMGDNLAGNALLIDAAGVRTAPLIYIANTGTDAATSDHVLFINQTGLLDSNLAQLTFGTAASTGNAIGIAMDTNVAGMAIDITSAATGVSGEGAGLNIAHSGNLVAGADLVRLDSTGSISSTSNVLSIVQRTGAGTAGAYGLHISTTGTNVEAIKVDDGNVVFDEELLVSGETTLGAGVIFSGIETIAAGGTSTALSLTETLHSVDADAGGDTFTLADGTIGQIMVVTCLSATGTATVTPENMSGGTSVTMDAAGESVIFMFVDTEWYIIGGNDYTVV